MNILSKEQVRAIRAGDDSWAIALCDSHEALRAEVERLNLSERRALDELARSVKDIKELEAELARLRPVVEAAEAQANKARSVMMYRGGPLSADHDFMGFVCATNEAVDALRAAKEGDAHAV